MTHKVYVIHAKDDRHLDLRANLKNTFDLDAAVQRLAIAEKADVHMHQYKDNTLGGMPVVLIECDEAFLAKITKLPLYKISHEIWPNIETIRRTDTPQIEAPQAMKKPKPPGCG